MTDYDYEVEFMPLLERVKADLEAMPADVAAKLTALASDHVHYAIEKRRECAPVLFNALDLMSLVGGVEDYHQFVNLFVTALYAGVLLAVDNINLTLIVVSEDNAPESEQ